MARLAKEKEDNPKYKCECGAEIKNQTSVIKKHKKTLKHKNWVLENK